MDLLKEKGLFFTSISFFVHHAEKKQKKEEIKWKN